MDDIEKRIRDSRKKKIKVQVTVHDEWDGKLDGLERRIEEAVVRHVISQNVELEFLGLNTIVLDKDYYGYDGGNTLVAVFERIETDNEYDARVVAEKKAAEKKAKDALTRDKKKKERELLQKKSDLETLEELAKKLGKRIV